jgi:SEC-C motif domain protein
MSKACICGSQKTLDKCCGRFLSGEHSPKTPEQLMRSRYSAYALGEHEQYLLDSWFPATASGITAESLSQQRLAWCGLEILDKSQRGDQGMVEFKASYKTESGELQAMHERSVFNRVAGRWLYVGGEVR